MSAPTREQARRYETAVTALNAHGVDDARVGVPTAAICRLVSPSARENANKRSYA